MKLDASITLFHDSWIPFPFVAPATAFESEFADHSEIDALITRFKKGDEGALEELISRYKHGLFRFIYRYVGDTFEADGILSHTFVKAWENRERYHRSKAQFQTWLYAIAVNLCRDHARKQRRHPADYASQCFELDERESRETIDTAEDPANDASKREERDLLRMAIDELPHELKSAVVLHCLEGHSQEKVAQFLGCSVKAIETRIYRAKQQLRARLERFQ